MYFFTYRKRIEKDSMTRSSRHSSNPQPLEHKHDKLTAALLSSAKFICTNGDVIEDVDLDTYNSLRKGKQ